MKEAFKKIVNISFGSKFVILALVLIVIFCICVTPVTLQNDTYYTIKIGEHISEYGIDMQDPFSWHQDLSYTYPHWLYDYISYLIYSVFGMNGIYGVTCILSAILGISTFLVNRKLLKNDVLSFLLTIGVIYMLKPYIAARAQLVTFILFILTILFIERFLETKKIRYAIPLILIPLLIANLHLAVFPFYFVLFLPYIAEYFIAIIGDTIIYRKLEYFNLKRKISRLKKKKGKEEKLEKLNMQLKTLEENISKRKIKRTNELENPYKIRVTKNKNVRLLILIMIIAIFTGFLTPLGNTPYTYLQKTMDGNTTSNINEHLPMTIANETEILCILVIILSILTFTKTKIRLSDLCMICGLLYLMIASRRQITMFLLIGSVMFGRLILNMTNYYDKEMIPKLTNFLTKIIPVGIITAFMLVVSYDEINPKFGSEYVDEMSYPTKACDYIIENIDLGTSKFYNEYNYGSYMLFRGIPVFVDSRADLYTPEFSGKSDDVFTDFLEISGLGRFYEDLFEKYNITHVIAYKSSKLNMIIDRTEDKNYKELYQDSSFIIYERLSAEKKNKVEDNIEINN